MDDGLFGFLVFIGIIVLSFVQNRRKVKEEAAEQAAPKKRVVIQDLTNPQKKAATVSVKPSKRKTYPPTSDFIGRNNYVPNELGEQKKENEVYTDYNFENMDDVKKAFVWSEILRRKY